MKVLMINGSPRANSNTGLALEEMSKIFKEEGIEVETIQIGNKEIRGCVGCGTCYKKGSCVFEDIVNETAPKFKEADGLVIGSPVYYASPNGTLLAFLDRLFYSSNYDKTMKVGCSIACARRSGTTATFDVLNKYFTISGMPVVSSTYWNNVHGAKQGEASQDLEGLQTMRNLAYNMVFLMKSIALGKEKYGMPKKDRGAVTNFIR